MYKAGLGKWFCLSVHHLSVHCLFVHIGGLPVHHLSFQLNKKSLDIQGLMIAKLDNIVEIQKKKKKNSSSMYPTALLIYARPTLSY